MKPPLTGRATDMVKTAATRIAPEFDSFSRTMAIVVMVIGAAVLLGWVVDNATLKSIRPGLVSMKANAAIGFLLAGGALLALHDPTAGAVRRRRGARAAAAAMAIGVLTLVEYAFDWNFAIDELVFRDSSGLVWTAHPGRMAPTTALDFVLVGLALRYLDTHGRYRQVEVLTLSALLISLFAYLAHLYALELLHGTGYYTHMAVHTTAAFCMLCTGILAARPERGLMRVVASDRFGGRVARRLLPAATAVPVVLAWLGFAGQRAGFYHSIFALASVTLAITLGMSVLILWSARSLEDLESEREKAEETERQSIERFHWLVDGVRDYAIFLLDAEGFVQTWNPGAERAFGYRESEVLGRPHSIFYAREDVAEGSPERQLRVAADESRSVAEGLRLRKDGSRFWAHVTLTALGGAEGRPRGFVHAAHDTTAHKALEEELKDAKLEHTRREQTLQQALAALTRAHEELKKSQLPVMETEKMESIGRLAAGVAHEVKNPLAVIQSGIDYLAGRPESPGPTAEVLDEMQKAVLRATAILGGLLDFSAPRTLELEAADVNALIEQALVHVRHDVERGQLKVVQALDEHLPPVQVDPRKMEQVFVNVLLNAIQAMPSGGTLSIHTFNARTRTDLVGGSRTSLLFRPRERAVVVEISDTGPGIPPDHLRKIFEPFFTTKPTRKGTGLGLTFSKAIVDMHGGSVNVTNRKEGGVRVTIALATKGARDGAQDAAVAD